jgi:hypothetical protein
VLPTNDPNES